MFNSLRKFMFNSLHNLRKTSPSLIHVNSLEECDWEAVKKHIKEKMENVKVIQEPFPHLHVDNIFPDDFYTLLLSQLPNANLFEDTHPHDSPCMLVPEHSVFQKLSEPQQVFWRYFDENISKAVIAKRLHETFAYSAEQKLSLLFGDKWKEHVESTELKPLVANSSVGTRGIIHLRLKGCVQEPHTDNITCINTQILYYAKDAKHKSAGITLYDVKNVEKLIKLLKEQGQVRVWYMDKEECDVQPVKRIDYLPNRLVAFAGLPFAVHSVDKINENFLRYSMQTLSYLPKQLTDPLFKDWDDPASRTGKFDPNIY